MTKWRRSRPRDPASAAAQHRRLIAWLCDRLGARAWVERSGSSLLYMNQLAALFRDAKFVHLYRDGRECAYSFSRHPGYRLGAVSAMLDSRLGMSPYLGDAKPLEQVPPDLRPFMPGTFDHEAFERFEVPVAETGQFWSDMIMPGTMFSPALPNACSRSATRTSLRSRGTRCSGWRASPACWVPPGWLDRAVQLAEPRSPRWTALPQEQISDLTRVCEPPRGSSTVTRGDVRLVADLPPARPKFDNRSGQSRMCRGWTAHCGSPGVA